MSQVTKSAAIRKSGAPSEADMAAINAQALGELGPGDVFAFRVAMCDTRVDRDFERFTCGALEEMASLFVGRPLIKDHAHRSDNQVGRKVGLKRVLGRCIMCGEMSVVRLP